MSGSNSSRFEGLSVYTGLVVLADPVSGVKPASLIFDAQISTEGKHSKLDFLSGKLAFYNSKDVIFARDATFYSVTCTVSVTSMLLFGMSSVGSR